MSPSNEIEAAGAELTHAMARLVRALDAVGDAEASHHLPAELPAVVNELASRLDAIQSFGS